MSVIMEKVDVRTALECLAPLFTYPYATPALCARETADAIGSEELNAFAHDLSALELAELQSVYTSTFDLAPSCSPYLGLHLFGEEGRERARLMVGLRLAYRRWGTEMNGELPDHIAEVVGCATKYDEDEWRELLALVLVPALTKMNALLSETVNPYRNLVAAAWRLAADAHTNGGES